ncbi:MAG: HD-GYP domain-containing protein [Holophagales bacterium]|jgi:putative nucleotidyltransferase with HDIG domain|nr:HD-GYP domain-containing protein [Holophagales bacterium]
MIKKVKIAELRLGMFIHDLNVPWIDDGFLLGRFMLQSEDQIEKLTNANILEVLIDTEKGLDAKNAPTVEEAEDALADEITRVIAAEDSEFTATQQKARWEESKQAYVEAISIVTSIFNDVRLGKQTGIKHAFPVVENITRGVMLDDGALISLCRLKNRDDYTFQHSVSVSALLITLCSAIGGYAGDDLVQIGLGGLFHDIGKMMTPDHILYKPGRLTRDEHEIMRGHVNEGLDYLRKEHGLRELALRVVAEHHEKYDGSGYPKGLFKDQISKVGQMASIIDVYDAITSNRVYHAAIEPTAAIRLLYEWAGRHFDGTLVRSFIRAVGIYPVGSLIRLQSGRLAVVIRQGDENLLQPLVRIVYNSIRGHRVPAQDLDLAAPNCQDYIVDYETPNNWSIDPIKIIEEGN